MLMGKTLMQIAKVMWQFESGEMEGVKIRTRFEGPRRAAKFTWRGCAEQTVETYLTAFSELQEKPWQALQLERGR
jgi:hypothetical protein